MIRKAGTVLEVTDGIFRVSDTCNVYLLRAGQHALVVDFGSGSVLGLLKQLGVTQLTDVFLTHHHRDQGQGLHLATSHGARVWVPPMERDLFVGIEEHWQGRPIDNDFDVGQDRFSLLQPLACAEGVQEYATVRYGSWEITAVPTPGHTPGSVSYLVRTGDETVVFTGDLIYSPGKVWSLASMQWTYTGLEGAGMTIASLSALEAYKPTLLLPAHGAPIDDPSTAMAAVSAGLQDLLDHRPSCQVVHTEARELGARLAAPYEEISEHLVMNRTSRAISYALLSKDGVALLIDYGYDVCAGVPMAPYRSARRPWLASLPALKERYGVQRVEVAVPTHYHDDHVAGFNLLREVEGTEVWAAENISDVLLRPTYYDLPCLWYDPVQVDRVVPLGEPVRWHEYELTLYELPGHTLYAVAIAFEVDGQRVLATGDQQDGAWSPDERQEYLNYQYRNGFEIDDFVASALLYKRLRPDLLISGHWAPRRASPEYLDHLLEEGERVARLHRQLLPLDDFDFGAGGFGSALQPYRSQVVPGGTLALRARVRNPFKREAEVSGELVVPQGWASNPSKFRAVAAPLSFSCFDFRLTAPKSTIRRARVGLDVFVGSTHLGQQAEALVDVRP